MPIYALNKHIHDKKNYGLYHNNKHIIQVYDNNQKVYQYQPYTPSEEIYLASPASFSTTLNIGVYQVALGAGWCGTWQSGVTPNPPTVWYSSRGGGAFVELVFYNPIKQSLTLSAPNAANATMVLGGTTMITCNTQPNNSTTGGTYNINSSLDVIQSIKTSNGNNGGNGPWDAPNVSSVSNYGNWGSTANSNGGARLVYLRYSK